MGLCKRQRLTDPSDSGCEVDGRPAPWFRISSPCLGSLVRYAEPTTTKERAARDDSKGLCKLGEEQKTVWEGFCSCCKRPLSFEEMPVRPDHACQPATNRCAYVVAVWGRNAEYALGAMVLGWSLRRSGTKHDLVALHTQDVPAAAVELLRRSGWTPREMKYLEAADALYQDFCLKTRFQDVFTKLRVLELTEYSKVLLLDADLLVRECIDDLFEMPAPAAMARGPWSGYRHGDRIHGRFFFSGKRQGQWSWGQSSGINAGVMLLQPDEQTYLDCLAEVTDPLHPEHIKGNGPEQDYLSRFYADAWRHIDVAYNFQLHQMYFCLSPDCLSSAADRADYLTHPERIKVIHYSSEPKPWARHLEEQYKDYSDKEWLLKVQQNFKGYRAWVEHDQFAIAAEVGQVAVGPDGKLRRVMWEDSRARPDPMGGDADCNGGERFTASNSSNDVPLNSRGETSGEGDTDSVSLTRENAGVEQVTLQDGTAGPKAPGKHENKQEDTKLELRSADGWLLGDAVETPEYAIKGAEHITRLSLDLWDEAYRELSAHLGDHRLAHTVVAAYDQPACAEDLGMNDNGNADQASASDAHQGWSNIGGWWVEGQQASRVIATCGILPQPYVHLIINGKLVLQESCEGIHVAAVGSDSEHSSVPKPATFTGDCADSIATWAEAVPAGATVLIAVLDKSGVTRDVWRALADAGLGCPSSPIPADYVAAAAVGRKGKRSWSATHAAPDLALASGAGFAGDAYEGKG